MARDYVADSFAPDLNSMKFQDKVKLKASAETGQKLLTAAFAETEIEMDVEADQKILNVVAQAKSTFRNKSKDDRLMVKRRMISEAESVYDIYLEILALYVELAKRAELDKKFEGISRLSDNNIVRALEENKEFTNLCLRRNINWTDDAAFVTKVYREAVRENNKYATYSQKSVHSVEEDLALLKYMLKNIILKHELVFDYYELKDIYWTEDMESIRAMVMHTLQPFADGGEIEIEKLDETWEESREFLETLYTETIDEEQELMTAIIPKLQNWEAERVSEIDKILIKMGLVELMNYPGIPVKVTINEIIEIAKNYSSEKSGTFINGVLDALSKDFQTEGKIRKSGRGMLDNR